MLPTLGGPIREGNRMCRVGRKVRQPEALDGRIDALEKVIDHFEGAVNTWRGIAAFLGISGVGAIIYAIVQSRP